MDFSEGYDDLQLAAIGANEAVVRQIDYALKKAAENIADPNTEITEKRVITVKIELKPRDRRNVEITAKTTTKLAGDSPIVDIALISRTGEGAVPMAEQLELPDAGVTTIREGAKDAR